MKPFINRIADYYIEHLSADALNACIVIPNRRAKASIRQAIVKALPQGGFLPTIYSMPEWIAAHTPGLCLDQTDLCYQLYHSFCQIHPGISFDDYLNYAHILLKDFEDIDMHLIDAQDVFSYLSDTKAIQLWSPEGGELSDSQKHYLDFYRKLAPIYHHFTEHLKQQNLWYQAMAYRQMATALQVGKQTLRHAHILFAGFGLLSTAEERIMQSLLQAKKAHCLWHTDHYYLDDELMEAGQAFRRYAQWHPQLRQQAQSDWLHTPKEVNVLGSPGQLAQVRILAQRLLQSSGTTRHAIVLPDEQLLIPLLNSLPKTVLSKLIIGLGYPISHSHCYRLLDALCRMHLQIAKQSQYTADNYRLNSSIVLEILHNPLINKYLNKHIKQDTHFKFSTISKTDLEHLLNKYQAKELAALFQFVNDEPKQVINLLKFSIEKVFDGEHIHNAQETDAKQQLYPILCRLQMLLQSYHQPTHLQAFYSLFKQLTQALKQQFAYQPEAKVQLMHINDTQLLTYDEVSILSLNEDSLPRTNFANSFVPLDIKYLFGLSSPNKAMERQAYTFYSLLQSAKKVNLYYSTTISALKGGEPSRFLKQLEFEWRKTCVAKVEWREQLLSFEDIELPEIPNITFTKNNFVMKQLKRLSEKGLSPTSISTYIRCPLQFCFKYVWQFYAPETAEEVIDNRLMGNVIHKVMEDLFKPYIGKNMPTIHYGQMLKELPQRIAQAYASETDADCSKGYNFLSLKDTEHYLTRFLQGEAQRAKDNEKTLRILSVEKPISRKLRISVGNEEWEILLKGIADRIDEYDGCKRILDYKAGSVEKNKLKSTISDYNAQQRAAIFSQEDYKQALQLFIYDWISKDETQSNNSHTGIIAFQHIESPYSMLSFPPASHSLYQQLEEAFSMLIQQIFDPKIDFSPTNNLPTCDQCDYKNICLKHS